MKLISLYLEDIQILDINRLSDTLPQSKSKIIRALINIGLKELEKENTSYGKICVIEESSSND